jgi:type I restriction enzyme, S subunit
MRQTESNKINLITKKLDDACFIDFGTRVVQKKDGGNIYPVYGGGGATFKMNTYNRENCLVVSRFAMSKQCTRFVEGKFYLNDSGLTVRPKNERELAQEYLEYLLLTLNDTIYSLSRGTAQRNLNVSKFRNLIINYPDSIELQLHIANLLSKAENLIAQRKESIRLLHEFLKSTFLEMFGDPVRNEKEWEKFRLGELINIKHGYAFSSEFFTTAGEFVLLTPGNYYEEGGYRDRGEKQKYYVGEFPSDYLLKKGDLLIAMTEQAAGLLGSAIIIPESNKFLHNQRLGLVQFDSHNLDTFFIYYLFNFNSIRFLIHAKATGIKVRHTSPGRIQEISVGIPPIELQTQFAQIVEKTETLKIQYQQSLQELEHLYGSLSQQAFRGELSISKNHKTVEI